MFIACWMYDVHYGAKADALEVLKEFESRKRECGWRARRARILSGSIGVAEARIVVENEFDSLDDLERSWDALHRHDAFKRCVEKLQRFVVSGSPRCEIYRLVETIAGSREANASRAASASRPSSRARGSP